MMERGLTRESFSLLVCGPLLHLELMDSNCRFPQHGPGPGCQRSAGAESLLQSFLFRRARGRFLSVTALCLGGSRRKGGRGKKVPFTVIHGWPTSGKPWAGSGHWASETPVAPPLLLRPGALLLPTPWLPVHSWGAKLVCAGGWLALLQTSCVRTTGVFWTFSLISLFINHVWKITKKCYFFLFNLNGLVILLDTGFVSLLCRAPFCLLFFYNLDFIIKWFSS